MVFAKPDLNNAAMDTPFATARPETPAEPLSEGAARRAARMATPRLQRERKTLGHMLVLWCREHHGQAARDDRGLCSACGALQDYADKRLAACPFGPEKPTCAKCQIHCYGPRQRETTRQVMRWAGPRMLLHHPVLALMHLTVDSRRPAPPKPRGQAAATHPSPADRGAQARPTAAASPVPGSSDQAHEGT